TPHRHIETWSRARPSARRCSRCEQSNSRALSAVPGTRDLLDDFVILPGRANPTGWNFWKPQVGRYAAPALLTACAVRRAHRILPGRPPGPRGVRAREREMLARTECGCHRHQAAVASP